ncbi:tRNA (5-methylaminomethyl-2-thiouridylate)-methyltransferase [Aphanomyces invadans]|uniref:tRNA-5-taurinomethyluridine 2-sulfurtransferase n=1 Tax=Aphanomyces invadans TaxID=157072 RepID=A0A024UDL6_9STRA|nr:tRNA (5-methylaminomethyl-2-thiouridylate)-methyltransferase [Aphanomyces invadans]ETW04359.1 tRNA (5-methylaminomethyl-2-thiouridylate)-methyltransferase [Aphanomyces invadans]|eukprot:XP_008867315.1 tRNA (5-methylaminomethyl-2-thiouridylate)-methyltransferase [Aphanomyces invadans]
MQHLPLRAAAAGVSVLHRRGMMSSSKKKVVVGMSGGVDSSVAAYLLHQDKSLEVHGLYMNNWDCSDEEGQATCPADMEYESVRQVCRDIGISCSRVDFVQTYWNNVFAPCLDEYAQGFTPNPDVLCNREIKFDAFANHAKDIGADFIATGHYAQLLPIPSSALPDSPSNGNGVLGLFAAADSNKDQTYFLSHVSLAAFQKVRFPLGAHTKPQVRQIASAAKLSTALAKESMGICFIGKRPFGTFLAQYVPPRKGHFVSVESNAVMHEHDGFSSYTIGQGAKVSGQSIKWFVVGKRDEDAAVLIAPGTHHPALFADHTYVDASAFNWLVPPHQIPSGFADNGTTTFRCFYRARYRQPLAACTVTIAHDLDATSLHPMRQTLPTSSTFLKVEFDIPQRGLAPGQSLVLYRDDGLCFGGGAIYCAGPSYWEMQKPLPSPLYDWRS